MLHRNFAESAFTALDIETTGLSPKKSKIVEIAALKILPDGQSEHYQTLVDPKVHIPDSVVAIHGITDDMVCGQPSAETAVEGLVKFVGDSPLVLHNARFDMSFINAIMHKRHLQWSSPAVFDTLTLSRRAFPGLPSYSLVNLSRFFDFDTGHHHRALSDCHYCAMLFEKILEEFDASDAGFEEFIHEYAAPVSLLGNLQPDFLQHNCE